MKKKKKKRIFKALDAQIRRISKDVAQNFVLLAESLDLMGSYELYEFEPNINDFRSYRRSVGLDHSRPGKIINIINFFNPYHDRPKGAYLMYQAGWTKLDLITGKKDKFEKALELGYLNFDDLALYAYKSTYRNLESKLENLNPPKLWDNVYRETHNSPTEAKVDGKIKLSGMILDGIYSTKVLFDQSFTESFFEDEFMDSQLDKIDGFSNSRCREAVGYIRGSLLNTCKFIEKFGTEPFKWYEEYIHLLRPSDLAKIEKAAVRVKPGSIGSGEVATRKLLNRNQLSSKDLVDMGIDEGRIKMWLRKGYLLNNPQLAEDLSSNKALFSLESLRKANLLKRNIKSGVSEKLANKVVSVIVNEELQFKIMTPYYTLAEHVLRLLNVRER